MAEVGALWEEEEKALGGLLQEFGDCFSREDHERGLVRSHIQPPYRIPTVPHEPWLLKPYKTAIALEKEALEVIEARLASGVIEPCAGAYANRFMLVRKKDNKYRFIQDLQPLNAVTIRDAYSPENPDRATEAVAGRSVYSSLDLHSGYDQVPLHPDSRDLTAISTPLGLFRMTRLPQGATNSVAVMSRAVSKTYAKYKLNSQVVNFIDDVALSLPASADDEEEASPGIRNKIYRHLLLLRDFFITTRDAGWTWSPGKSHLLCHEVGTLGYVVGSSGRRPSERNVNKTLTWEEPTSLKALRGFLSTAGFYRVWVKDFATMAEPLFRLTKKSAKFAWGPEQQRAFEALKEALSAYPVLRPPDYEVLSSRPLIVTVDAGPVGMGAVLGQDDERGVRYACRYMSSAFNEMQRSRYGQTKRELLGLVKALKYFQPYLIGTEFVVETDALSIIGMVNSLDMVDPTLTRWVAWIKMFNPIFRHIAGKENVVADALSRCRPGTEDDGGDVEQHIDGFIGQVTPAFSADQYSERHARVGNYLSTLSKPLGMSSPEFKRLRSLSYNYLLESGRLFRRAKGAAPRLVVDSPQQQQAILEAYHDESGHKSVGPTFEALRMKYFWSRLYQDAREYCQSCKACQLRSSRRYEEPLTPIPVVSMFKKWFVDVVYAPDGFGGYRYIIMCREGASDWLEAAMLKDKSSKSWTRFIKDNIIMRYGCQGQFVTDRGELRSAEALELCERYRINITFTTSYHPQSNARAERGHGPFVNALTKMCEGPNKGKWPMYFMGAVWADRITTRRTTGMSPYYMVYGQESVLPVDAELDTWYGIQWKQDMTTEELLAARLKQLARHPNDVQAALERLNASREKNRIYFNKTKVLRSTPLKIGDLVLLFDSSRQTDMSVLKKFQDKWSGPFKITSIAASGYYKLSELDGTPLREGAIAGNRVKLFVTRAE